MTGLQKSNLVFRMTYHEKTGYSVYVGDNNVTPAVRTVSVDVDDMTKRPVVRVELRIDAIDVVDLGATNPWLALSISDDAREALRNAGWIDPEEERRIVDRQSPDAND